MMRMGARIFLALCLLHVGLCAQMPEALGAREVAAKIDARYNGMKSLSAEFTENYSNGAIRSRPMCRRRALEM